MGKKKKKTVILFAHLKRSLFDNKGIRSASHTPFMCILDFILLALFM